MAVQHRALGMLILPMQSTGSVGSLSIVSLFQLEIRNLKGSLAPMPIDHDPNPDYQRYFGIGAIIGGAITTAIGKMWGRTRRVRDGQYMRTLAREALTAEIMESEHWKHVEKRFTSLKYQRDDDRRDMYDEFAALHRRLDRIDEILKSRH